MTRPLRRVLAALCLAVAALPAAAQQQNSVAGQWYCEMGFQNTAPGVQANAVMAQFQMVLSRNGGAQGQGNQSASSGQFPFQFQGQWGMQGPMVIVQGQQNGGLGFGPSQFFFQSKLQGANNMAFTHRYQNQQMQVYASQCVRQG